MFKSEVVEQICGCYTVEQKNFYLTRGDTATITSTPRDENKEIIEFGLIAKCEFILLEDDKEIFSKEFHLGEDNLVVRIESSESDIDADTYVYKVKYTFVDGSVATPNRGLFTIID